jgi:hypothetical protein
MTVNTKRRKPSELPPLTSYELDEKVAAINRIAAYRRRTGATLAESRDKVVEG